MYKEYQRRRKNGMTRSEAVKFDSGETVQQLLLPKESPADVDSYLWELRDADYVMTLDAADTVYYCELTTEAIQKLEKLPADTVKSIAKFLGNFVP